MARLPRFVLPNQPQHVIVRGTNRADIFCADADYLFYLDKLQLASDKHHCKIHAYVLMSNHVHLLVTPKTEEGLSKFMQMLGRYYVQYFNDTYQRAGSLWEGRYKATLIDSAEYLLTCMRYIEQNPVRAKIVAHAADYAWSSYAYNALGLANELVRPHLEYVRLGDTPAVRETAYRRLFKHRIADSTLAEIREATNKAWVLGGDRFKRRIQKKLERPVEPSARGGDRKSEKFRADGG